MKIAIAFAVVILAGCTGLDVQNMSDKQIRATNGMVACGAVTTLYGKSALITANADDVHKGISTSSETIITCGDASLTIRSNSATAAGGAARATTTTTTTTTPQ